MTITTSDGKTFESSAGSEVKFIGGVKKIRGSKIDKEYYTIGDYPVFVEQHGAYRMFTYNKKIVSIKP